MLHFFGLQAVVLAACWLICFAHEHCCKHVHEKFHAELDAVKDFSIHLVIYSGLIIPHHTVEGFFHFLG